MSNLVARSSKGLLTIAGFGITIITLGFIYFTGIGGSPGRLFFGLDYGILTVFGFYLVLIGLFPVLSNLDAGGKKSLKKLYVHLVLFMAFGAILLIYSVLVPQPLALLDPRHSWQDYFAFGALILVLSFSMILFSVQDRERLWKLKFLFLLVFFIGFLLEILSILANFNLLESLGFGKEWWIAFYFYGGVILLLGLIAVLLTASQRFREIIHSMRILWILMIILGLVIFIVPSLILNNLLVPVEQQSDIWTIIPYFGFLSYGSFVLILGLLLFVSSDQNQNIIRKLRYISPIIFLFGFIQVVIAAIWALSSSPQINDFYSGVFGLSIIATDNNILGVGMTWDIFFINGLVTTLVSLTLICSNLYFEKVQIGDVEDVIPSVGKLPVKDATPTEMITYLHILGQSNKGMIAKFKEAARKDKLRPRVYEKLVQTHQNQMRIIKSRIENLQKKAPTGAEALFDAALADISSPEAESPISSITEEPKIPATAPSPPKISPMPPSVPSSTTPPPIPPTPSTRTSPPIPPAPSTTSPPPIPSPTPSASEQSPLDLIADARSTSIAELRGEMLKELRRLREIFKEE